MNLPDDFRDLLVCLHDAGADFEVGNKAFGEATLFTCLFSDDW